ncbi:hypothetical protein [Kitasatospora sp. NPDC001527]
MSVRILRRRAPERLFTASPGHPVALTVDTGNRPGGCRLQLRLNV